MQLIKVAAAVVNTRRRSPGSRIRRYLLAAIADARARGRVDPLPARALHHRLRLRGRLSFARHAGARHSNVLEAILPATRGMVVSLGLPVLHPQRALQRRLPGGRRHDRWASSPSSTSPATASTTSRAGSSRGRRASASTIELDGRRYPDRRSDVRRRRRADRLRDLRGRLGRQPAGRAAGARRGVDVILNPSASHFAFGKLEMRQRFVLEGSRAFGVSYVYANLLGNEAGRAIYDGGALIATGGQLVAAGPRFSFADWSVTTRGRRRRRDPDEPGPARRAIRPRLDDAAGEPGSSPARSGSQPSSPSRRRTGLASWETRPHLKEEEFTRAVALGLFDYLRKSRSRGFVVSLSGGADSAAVAVPRRAHGPARRRRAGLARAVPREARLRPRARSGRAIDARSCGSSCSASTRRPATARRRPAKAARAVAEAVGAEFHELDVDPLVEGYVRLVAARDRPAARPGRTDDLALQNIQARVRAPGRLDARQPARRAAALDQQPLRGRGRLRDDGRRHLRRPHADRRHRQGVPPALAALAGDRRARTAWARSRRSPSVNAQAPTAELRPPAASQTDEDDLMPYDAARRDRAARRSATSTRPLEVLRS